MVEELKAAVKFKAMTDKEIEIFDKEWDALVAMHFAERKIIDIFEKNKAYVAESADLACAKMKKPYGGINAAAGQIGPTMPRPEFYRDYEDPSAKWEVNVTATGWANLWGTAANKLKVEEEALYVHLGLINYCPSPKSTAWRIEMEDKILPVYNIEHAMRSEGAIKVFEFAKPHRIVPESSFYTRVKYDALGVDELAPLGIIFADGAQLRKETPKTD